MAKVSLWVRCHTCGVHLDTGLRMEDRAFTRGTLAVNYHTCPNCGVRDAYRKADYELRQAPVGRSGPA